MGMGGTHSTDMGRSSLLLCSLLALAASERTYHGYTVLRTEKLDATTSKLVYNELAEVEGLSFWKDPAPGRQADIMAAPHMKMRLESWLQAQGIGHSPMVKDVQSLIEETRPSPKKSKSGAGNYTMDWKDYHDHSTLNEFIAALADANDWANVINIGQSYEGRDMDVLAITKAGPGAPNIWLEAGIHAREWISPAVATFLVRELVEDYAEHPDYIDKINWYFIPSANPDGYAYSWEHDRLWRKTRSDNGGIPGCKGVDPNRNWGYHYGESGVSHNRCMETYCGPEAFSEVEMRNIRDFVTTLDPVPVLGHCFHSYSQLWLWPYGYWYKGVLGTRYAFTTELRDTGVHGFVLPKDQIIPSGEEMWAGFEVVINKILSDIQES